MRTEEESTPFNTCLSCRKTLKSSMPDEPDGGPPHDGMVFTSRGNYGSALYDPTVFQDSTEFLRVVICDECVAKAAADGLIQQGLPQPVPETQYRLWRLPTDPAEGMTETEYLLSSPANAQRLAESVDQSRRADAEFQGDQTRSAGTPADVRPTLESDPDSTAAASPASDDLS
jgi:hypothetical protein